MITKGNPRALLSVPALALLGVGFAACQPQPGEGGAPTAMSPAVGPIALGEDTLIFFKALPAYFENPENPKNEAKVALGRMLYFDTRLSKNHDVSCNSCHLLDAFGVDNKQFSEGHKKQLGGRNSPTTYNAGDHIAQFWDGRAKDLEAQALGPVMNPLEMAMPNEKRVVDTLASMPQYVEAFAQAFPGEKEALSFANMGKAIAAYERGLVTRGRLDAYLEGDKAALTDEEKRGMKRFAELGCVTCHNGPAVGGSSFQRIGQVVPYEEGKDLGRFDVTKNAADKRVFRVPSLRNVAKTAPYFSDGSKPDLHVTITTMAKHQLGKTLSAEDEQLVIAFLHALTGEAPAAYIKQPELPPSTPKTPKPDPS